MALWLVKASENNLGCRGAKEGVRWMTSELWKLLFNTDKMAYLFPCACLSPRQNFSVSVLLRVETSRGWKPSPPQSCPSLLCSNKDVCGLMFVQLLSLTCTLLRFILAQDSSPMCTGRTTHVFLISLGKCCSLCTYGLFTSSVQLYFPQEIKNWELTLLEVLVLSHLVWELLRKPVEEEPN